MKTIQTIDSPLPKVLSSVKDNEFKIPMFQRDFTWNDSQVKLLIDSIARGYPMGSLLLLPKSKEIDLYHTPLQLHEGVLETNTNEDDFKYVLDGQQRLTSLSRIFLDAHPSKHCFFDLEKLANDFDTDEDTSWIAFRRRGVNNPSTRSSKPFKDNLLRADVVLDQQTATTLVLKYFQDSATPEEQVEAINKFTRVSGIFERIRNYALPFVMLDGKQSLDSICRIFETINSTGTRLTTFDLAVAKYYPEPNLKNLYQDCVEKYPRLASYGVEGERFLQVLALIYNSELGKRAEPTRAKLLAIDKEYIAKHWMTTATKFNQVIDWIESLGAFPSIAPNLGLLVSLTAVLVEYPTVLSDTQLNFNDVAKRWFFNRMLSNQFDKGNHRMYEDYRNLKNYIQHKEPMSLMKLEFSADDIINMNSKGDFQYCAVMYLMSARTGEDLITGQSLDNLEKEDHHIFPISFHKKHGLDQNKLNSVVNRIIVSKTTNQDLSDTEPAVYFLNEVKKAQDNQTTNLLTQRLTCCLIPVPNNGCGSKQFIDDFNIERFEVFLLKRAHLIKDELHKILG